MWKLGIGKSKAILKLSEIGHDQTLDYAQIEKTLSSFDGIHSVRINAITNTVKIEYDQKRITIEELRSAVRKACDMYSTRRISS